MGWRSISRSGEIRYEGHSDPELGGRPVAQGEEGSLAFIEQSDYGHRVGIDLIKGIIAIDYEEEAQIQNGTLEIKNPKTILWIAEDTSVVGDMAHLEQTFELARDEKGRKIHDENGRLVQTRTDHLTPLTWRPIWFTRNINGMPNKIIGAQTTLPEMQGGGNCKQMVMLYVDGRLGIYSSLKAIESVE